MPETRERQPPDEQVPLITLPNWVKAAAACGFNIGAVIEELGIEADLLHVESATVARQDMERLMAACVARSKRRHFPFALGETFAFEYLPDLETFLTTSATLRESARVLGWLRVLVNPYLALEVHESGELASLRLDAEGAAVPQSFQWFMEATFATVLKVGRALLQGRGDFRGVSFQVPSTPYALETRERFRLPVRYGQPHNALELDRRLLDLPLQGAFATLHQQAEQRVVERLSLRAPATAGLRGRIERVLERKPALLGQGLRELARELDLHPRALQRRLKSEGLSFEELQSGLRLRLAKTWLADTALDIETISERLGFSDRRSFTRAFARWTGDTPSAFRSRR